MSEQTGSGCVEPAAGVLTNTPEAAPAAGNVSAPPVIRARVGQPAPDFEASAFVDGGFKNIKLSDYRGKWVVLCFYPGDFTFV
jgi:hypothetical protein